MQLFKKYLKPILRTEAFSHIGFEAKQELKPYYIIVHKAFQGDILRKLGQFFQDAVIHVSDNTEYKM